MENTLEEQMNLAGNLFPVKVSDDLPKGTLIGFVRDGKISAAYPVYSKYLGNDTLKFIIGKINPSVDATRIIERIDDLTAYVNNPPLSILTPDGQLPSFAENLSKLFSGV